MCLSNSREFSMNAQSGIGLPATVFLISILALIVVAMGDLTEQSQLGFGQDYESTRAFYAAESGAQIALNRVFVDGQACSAALSDIDFDGGGANPGLDNCEAEISCTSITITQTGVTTEYLTFTSIGRCGSGFEQATREIEVRAHE